jgi:hypothetical protein
MIGYALVLDDSIIVDEFYALFSQNEIDDAAQAAEQTGLPVDEGVGYFIVLSISPTHQNYNQRLFFERMRQGHLQELTEAQLLSVMHYAMPILLGEKDLRQDLAEEFAFRCVVLPGRRN